jgi:hypothetical protein
MKASLSALLILLSSLASAQALMKFVEDTAAMRKEILLHIPIGTNTDSVQKIMERNKFSYEGDYKNEIFLTDKKMDFLFFFHDEGVIFCMNRWKAAMVYKEGKLSDVVVQFVVICL